MAELAPNLPKTRLVCVAAREADMMPLMPQALACPVDWLVKARMVRQQSSARRVDLPAGKNKTYAQNAS